MAHHPRALRGRSAALLPPAVPAVGVGGAIDVAFLGRTPFVLVTVVGPEVGHPDTVSGLYQVRPNGTVRVVADIGAWSTAHPRRPASSSPVASSTR